MANKYLRRNWAIYAGLNYRKTMVQVDSLSDLNLGYITAGGTSTTTPTVGANSSLIPVKKIILKELNYLELPVGVNYNFNKKWSVLAGIKMAYLMSPNVGISADSTVFFLKNVSTKQANYALDQSNSVAALGLQRWDIGTIGGINYSINNKISLSVRYDYGFKNVLNRANWAAYNRFIGFNAVYYFR